MFGYLNRCEFIGRLGADPESRNTQNGERVVNLRLAVSESWKDKNTGERKERTEWVSVVIWNQTIARIACDFLKKGSRAYISGRQQTRKWQDQEGKDRYTTEIILPQFGGDLQILDNKNDQSESQSGKSSEGINQYQKQSSGYSSDLDDSVPF